MRGLLGLEQTCHPKDMPLGVQNPSFQIPLFSLILSSIKLLVDCLFPLRKLRGTQFASVCSSTRAQSSDSSPQNAFWVMTLHPNILKSVGVELHLGGVGLQIMCKIKTRCSPNYTWKPLIPLKIGPKVREAWFVLSYTWKPSALASAQPTSLLIDSPCVLCNTKMPIVP